MVYSGSEFSGIYGWQCHKTSKWNVGESLNVLGRTSDYCKNRINGQTLMERAIDKYTINEFSCYKLEECVSDKNVLSEREVFWGKKLNSLSPDGYNLSLGCNKVMCEETKTKISNTLTGRKLSKEHAEKARTAAVGSKRTEQSIQKLREINTGNKNPMYGKRLSNRTKKLISEKSKLHRHSKETKMKLSESRKGNSNPFFGRKHSEETKRKISESLRGENNPRKNAEWTDEQRIKFQLTVYNRQREERLLQLFLEKYKEEWKRFKETTKI